MAFVNMHDMLKIPLVIHDDTGLSCDQFRPVATERISIEECGRKKL